MLSPKDWWKYDPRTTFAVGVAIGVCAMLGVSLLALALAQGIR